MNARIIGRSLESYRSCGDELAVAEQLGMEPTIFPSHHGGFLGGEYGQTVDPDAFAHTLRLTLDTAGYRWTQTVASASAVRLRLASDRAEG